MAAICIAAGVTALLLRDHLLDPEGIRAAAREIAESPAVRERLTLAIVDDAFEAVPAALDGLREPVATAIGQTLDEPEGRRVLARQIALLYERVLRSSGSAGLSLAELQDAIVAQLDPGLVSTLLSVVPLSDRLGSAIEIDASTADRLRTTASWVDRAAAALPLAGAAALTLGLLVSVRRLRDLGVFGALLAGAGALSLLALPLFREATLAAAAATERPTVSAIWTAATRGAGLRLVAIAMVGVAIAAVTVVIAAAARQPASRRT